MADPERDDTEHETEEDQEVGGEPVRPYRGAGGTLIWPGIGPQAGA